MKNMQCDSISAQWKEGEEDGETSQKPFFSDSADHKGATWYKKRVVGSNLTQILYLLICDENVKIIQTKILENNQNIKIFETYLKENSQK